MELTGKIFGRLTVIGRAEDVIGKNGRKTKMWNCICECGNLKSVAQSNLLRGSTKSCGCIVKENLSEYRKRRITPNNKYDLSGDYGVGYASNNSTTFYFDLEDYNKIKPYKWRDSGEYMETRDLKSVSKLIVFMHDVILKHDEKLTVDHISHNTYDNRKQNLRIGTRADNIANRGLMKNNTSGCTGVHWCNNVGKWRAEISRNKRRYTLGFYEDFNEAVAIRKQAEEKYFGEWSYANSMKYSKKLQ